MNTSQYCQTPIIQIGRYQDNSCSNENIKIKKKRRNGNTSTIKLNSAKNKTKQNKNNNLGNKLSERVHVKLSLLLIFEREGHYFISMANFSACLGLHLCKQIFEEKKQLYRLSSLVLFVWLLDKSDNQG